MRSEFVAVCAASVASGSIALVRGCAGIAAVVDAIPQTGGLDLDRGGFASTEGGRSCLEALETTTGAQLSCA